MLQELFITHCTYIGLLNSTIVGIGCSGSMSVDLICRGRLASVLDSKHFFIVLFTNLLHASTWPLLWLLNHDVTACFMFNLQQNSLNFSEIKLVPASGFTLLGNQYLANMTSQHLISYSADSPSAHLAVENLLW